MLDSAKVLSKCQTRRRSSSSFPGKVTIVTEDSVVTLDHARPSYHRHLLSYVSPSISSIFDVAGRVGFSFHEVVVSWMNSVYTSWLLDNLARKARRRALSRWSARNAATHVVAKRKDRTRTWTPD